MRIYSTLYQPQTTYPWGHRVYVPLFVVMLCSRTKYNPMLMFLSHHLCCNVFNGHVQRNELRAHAYSIISFALLKCMVATHILGVSKEATHCFPL